MKTERSEGKTAAEVSMVAFTDQARSSGLKVLFAALAANTSGRALAMRLGQTTTEGFANTEANEVLQHSWPNDKPFEDVWRDWVKKVSNLPTGSLSAQALA